MSRDTPPGRLLTLDALRGFAVMGILTLNIVGFAMPEPAYVNPAAWGHDRPGDVIAWLAGFVLFDGKMRGLFSLLFGASMVLIIDRTEAAGGDGFAVHANRMAWLLAFGVLHALLWSGDILVCYAIAGSIAWMFVHRQPGEQLRLAAVCFALHMLVVTILALGTAAELAPLHDPHAEPADIAWARIEHAALPGPGSPDIALDLARYRGSLAGIVAAHAADLPDTIINVATVYMFDTLGFMLLGMALLRGGFLSGEAAPRTYRGTLAIGLALGLPPAIGLGLWLWASDFDRLATLSTFFAWSFPPRIALTLAWTAGLILLIRAAAASRLIGRVAATGRAAFSNYLGTTIVMTAVFDGWGLGLYGRIDRMELIPLVLAAWLAMLLWSPAWLARMRYGPFEWLWRSLARRQLQPLRRPAIIDNGSA